MSGNSEQQNEFIALLEIHGRIAFKVARIYCRLPHDRDDLVQEILGQLWRSFASYDRQRSFATWMYRVALNVAISGRRSAPRQAALSLEGAAIDPVARSSTESEVEDQISEMYRLIEQLPAANRALLLLYVEDRSYAEIAEILGISETNVATKISRLKQQLRDQVDHHDH